LWRNIISLSINLEEKTVISLCSNCPSVNRSAREYFGMFTDIKPKDCQESAVNSLLSGDSTIGVFEIEKLPSSKPWWLTLSEKGEGLSIFASLPFFDIGSRDAFAVAKIEMEKTGEDKFIFVSDSNNIDGAEVISEYKGKYLCLGDSEDVSNNIIGCFAVF